MNIGSGGGENQKDALSRRFMTLSRPVLKKIKESSDGGYRRCPVGQRCLHVARIIAWPQPTGIGDLDDLENQC